MGLTAAFLALAAGATAACDTAPADPWDAQPQGWPADSAELDATPTPSASPSPSPSPTRPARRTQAPSPPPAEDVFYCADADGEIVADDFCDDESPDYDDESYYLWHSPRYGPGLAPGDRLTGGSRIALTDTTARVKAGLPPTGFVGNGSVKTNLVGRSSTGDFDGYTTSGG